MSNEVTEDFLEGIASQARSKQAPASSPNQSPNDTSGGINENLTTQGGDYTTRPSYLDQTMPKEAVPILDETMPHQDQSFSRVLQPEISSYVLHENSINRIEPDDFKSLREGTLLQQTSIRHDLRPSLSFENITEQITLYDNVLDQIERPQNSVLIEDSQILLTRDADQFCEEFHRVSKIYFK
jgi:hypothetical protein